MDTSAGVSRVAAVIAVIAGVRAGICITADPRSTCRVSAPTQASTEIPTGGLSLEDNERSLLVRALEKTEGNQTQAARLLRITRDTLRYKMKKFNLR